MNGKDIDAELAQLRADIARLEATQQGYRQAQRQAPTQADADLVGPLIKGVNREMKQAADRIEVLERMKRDAAATERLDQVLGR